MSYRSAGLAVVFKNQQEVSIIAHALLGSPKLDRINFCNMHECMREMETKLTSIRHAITAYKPNCVIVELPCFSQDAKSAVMLGLCWGAISQLDNAILVEPAILKWWSESKRGDGKNKVFEKVSERFFLTGSQTDDNVVDAIGLCSCFLDLVSIESHFLTYHETTKK